MIRQALKSAYHNVVRIFLRCVEIVIFRHLPIKRRTAVFCNFGGRGFGDNLAPIANELASRCEGFEVVWLVNGESGEMPEYIRCVRRGSLLERYYLNTAKFVVSNVKNALEYDKREGCLYIQTWHGDAPLKAIEGECESELSVEYVRQSKVDGFRTDLVVSGCSWLSQIARTSFWIRPECEILESGMPRNDVYYHLDAFRKKALKQKYGLCEERKYALYAPTFRDDGRVDCYSINVRMICNSLTKRFGGAWCVLLRLHPNVPSRVADCLLDECWAINASSWPDPQEIVCISDVLISDVSSMIFDARILNLPVFLFFPDFESYMSNCRSIKPQYFKLPFAVNKTNEALATQIESYDICRSDAAWEKFCDVTEYRRLDDGHASERVVDWMLEKINER